MRGEIVNRTQKEKGFNGKKILSTTDISRELGFQISAKKIKSLGFEPTVETNTGCFWQASSFPVICMGLSAYINSTGIDFISDRKFKKLEEQ
jgi:hypothetical protein